MKIKDDNPSATELTKRMLLKSKLNKLQNHINIELVIPFLFAESEFDLLSFIRKLSKGHPNNPVNPV